jgi:cytochrome P450
VSAVEGFFLALTVYPEVQRKAQAEIDRVIGTGRLPTVADRDNLPYINAIVKEALRWHTVVPLCVPHKTDEDDVVNGFLIPKGALLLPNIWYCPSVLSEF